jgi:hypothetical protein
MTKTVGMMLIFLGLSGLAAAAVPAAPEIDPASASSALAFLTGALLVIHGRRKN